MMSIASYMSTVSLNQPIKKYSSNNLKNNNNFVNKNFQNDYESDLEEGKNEPNMTRNRGGGLNSSIGDLDTDELDEEMDFLFKMQAKQMGGSNFNRISENFNTAKDLDSTLTKTPPKKELVIVKPAQKAPLSNPTNNNYFQKEVEKNPFISNESDNLNKTNAGNDLLNWCKEIISNVETENFKTLNIQDFSDSWSNGLAFCALIHHFRPDSM
jgi:hypothetical protein